MLKERRRTEIIAEMLTAFECSKRVDGAALSVSEYIRLLQIYEEMAENEGGAVTVRWVDTWDPTETG